MKYENDYSYSDELKNFYDKVKESLKRKVSYNNMTSVALDNVDMNLLKEEICRFVFLDTQYNKLGYIQFKGITNQCFVYMRKVIKKAISLNSTCVIMIHNHPAKSDRFSDSDYMITQKAYIAFKSIDMYLEDHILLHGTGHKSLRLNDSLEWKKILKRSKSIF